MTAISAHRPLGDFPTFDSTIPLAARLDALRAVPGHLVAPWRTLLEFDLAPDVRRALVGLLARSDGAARPLHRWLHAAARLVARRRAP
jgi:hypothetical protein